MKRLFNAKTTAFVVAFSCAFIASSCVNTDYELSEEKIDTNVTIFQEGLTLPLGTTAPVKLTDLYDMLDPELQEIIQNKGGKYGFSYAGNMDFTDSLASVKEMLAIDALSIKENFSFDLSNVSLDGLEIEGTHIPQQGVNISQMLQMPDLDNSLPKLNQSLQGASIELPKLNADDINVDFTELIETFEHTVPIISLNTELNVPDIVKNRPEYYKAEMLYSQIKNHPVLNQYGVNLPDIADTYSFDEYSVKVPIRIVLPKEIQSVEEIKLHEDARFELILQMLNPFFTVGAFTPHILINLHDLFHVDKIMSGMEDEGYMDHDGINHHIHDNFVMSAENGWKADHIYHIEKLAYNDWKKDAATGQLVLDKEIEITLSGKLELGTDELMTTLELLETKGREPMSLKVDINFFDFSVDDVVMKVAPISMTEVLEMPFNISGIQLPDMVKKVEYVEFDKNSPLNINMLATVPEACKDMTISLKTLKLEFPEGLQVEHPKYDSSNRTLVYSDVSLSQGLNDNINISKLSFGDLVDGSLNCSGAVKVTALAEASGTIRAKDLLDPSKSGKVEMNVNVSYAPQLEDYSVVIDDYRYKVEIDPVRFSEELPAEVGEMEKVCVYLEDDPVIKINLDYPTTIESLSIVSDKVEGLKMYFPKMLKFKSLPSSYNYDAATNSISFTKGQALPKVIELPVDRLEIVPEKDGDKYFVKGEMKVEGGICLESTTITKSIVDQIKNGDVSISFSASVPSLKPAKLALDQYVATINESFDLELTSIEGLPEMIKIQSVEAFDLDNVYLNLSVDASSVAEVIKDVEISMNFDVTLPELIKVEGAGDGNVIKITGKLNEKDIIVMDPIHVVGLDLSRLDFSKGSIELGTQSIAFDGSVTLNNVSLDIAELKDADLNVVVEGRLATKDTELIKIAKVKAKVDCQFELNESFELGSLTAQLGDKLDYIIDFNRFHLDFDLKTNLSLPVQLSELKVIPYKEGVAGTPLNMDQPIDLNINTNGQVAHSKIRISNLESDKHDDPEYHHVVLDVLSLIKDMPDSIQLCLKAGTKENATLVVEPSLDYVLSADYVLELPLEFGEDFKIEFADTLGGLPSILSDVLALGSLGLSGEVTNSFPIALDLEFQLLDVVGNVIPMSEGTGYQTIKAGNLDGTPVKTDLDVVLSIKKGIEVPPVDAIKLIFRATSSGAGLAEDNFIQVQLNALIPEGLSVDLKDLMGTLSDPEIQ